MTETEDSNIEVQKTTKVGDSIDVQKMTGVRDFIEVSIPVPWGTMSGKWWGPQGKQAILVLHGWQDNAGSFDELVKFLPEDWSILAIEFPGHGLSSHLPKGINYNLYWDGVISVRRLLKHFCWKDVVLMGHSMGGAISFLYAACYPDDVKAVISLDMAGPHIDTPTVQVKRSGSIIDKLLKYESTDGAETRGLPYEEMVDIVEDAYSGSLTRESCEIMLRRGMYKNSENPEIYHFARDPRLKIAGLGLLSLDLILELASNVKCCYLNIKAVPENNKELLSNYKLVLEKMENSVKEYKYVEVKGTHHVHLNDPQQVAPHIIDFIQRKPCVNGETVITVYLINEHNVNHVHKTKLKQLNGMYKRHNVHAYRQIIELVSVLRLLPVGVNW